MPDPLRALFLLGSLDTGGSERQAIEILRGLDRAAFHPLLYTVYGGGELQNEVPEDVRRFSYWDGRKASRAPIPGLILMRQARDLAGVLRRERVDVICDRNFHMTMLAALACWMRATSRVSVIPSDPAIDLPIAAGRYFGLKRPALQWAYRRAARVVAVSDGVREVAQSYYRLPPGHAITIYNLCNLDRIERDAAAFTPPMRGGRFRLVSVGRLHEYKGLKFLVDAISDVVHRRGTKDLDAYIVGGGPLADPLREQVHRLQLDDHVHFVGHLANPLPFVQAADLFCLPSLCEGMPNALVEAMACGTPVLATDCRSGPREILKDGQFGGLVPIADALALANAIADAITNPAAWRVRTDAARRHVEGHYALEIGLAAYASVLRNASRRTG